MWMCDNCERMFGGKRKSPGNNRRKSGKRCWLGANLPKFRKFWVSVCNMRTAARRTVRCELWPLIWLGRRAFTGFAWAQNREKDAKNPRNTGNLNFTIRQTCSLFRASMVPFISCDDWSWWRKKTLQRSNHLFDLTLAQRNLVNHLIKD